jgi:hypothetical protein
MSIVSPVAATAPVVPVAAAIVLGESPTPIQRRRDHGRRDGDSDHRLRSPKNADRVAM